MFVKSKDKGFIQCSHNEAQHIGSMVPKIVDFGFGGYGPKNRTPDELFSHFYLCGLVLSDFKVSPAADCFQDKSNGGSS
jgi:hypothetical protein